MSFIYWPFIKNMYYIWWFRKSVVVDVCRTYQSIVWFLKTAVLQMLRKYGKYWSSYVQLTKSFVKHRFYMHNLLRYKRSSTYVYSRNFLVAEQRIVCLRSKISENMYVFFITNIFYTYLKRYLKIFVNNDLLVHCIFWRTAALKRKSNVNFVCCQHKGVRPCK